MSLKCKICDREISSIHELTQHLIHDHKLTFIQIAEYGYEHSEEINGFLEGKKK